jgi:isopentenyl-diphosphate delta-isomerase
LEHYRLIHQALPEVALAEVDTSTQFLGHRLSAPLLISSMTGGTSDGGAFNRRLAAAAQEVGIAMGVGSQRVGIEHPETMHTFAVRDVAPDILLLANLGAVQLNKGYGLDECRHAVEAIEADGLILHLNALQEAVQPHGDTDFSGLIDRIAAICDGLDCPVIVKEVGWGLSVDVARQLVQAGVAALDVAGAGGTSWSRVESYRHMAPTQAEVARAFDGWGIPTARAIESVHQALPTVPLIGSGGIANGLQAATALALGADLVGMARALLPAAAESISTIVTRLDTIIQTLRIAMFCTGARTVDQLDSNRLVRRLCP